MTEIPDVIILSGGFGLRLRGVIGDVPKPMAQIGGRPFMELLLRQLKRYGFSRVILSVGYRHEVIREHFGERAFGLELIYSVETTPLGTGGALRDAAKHVTAKNALIMNGDSYTDVDLNRVAQDHVRTNADVTIVVIPGNRGDAGSVVLDCDGKITTFAEKSAIAQSRYLSAGIYILNKDLASTIPEAEKISLEEQLFPQWLATGKNIQGFVFEGPCLDIGTPERFQEAQHLLEKVELESVFESEDHS
jgi:D-glycero-alpha-D-manno-heptose 1-phosphate guanylyltransferase